jgi:hypothetical protein
MTQLQLSTVQFLFDEKSIDINMLGLIILHWIVSNAEGRFIIAPQLHSGSLIQSELYQYAFKP